MIQFKKLSEEHLEQVLAWRTQEDVTRFMNTDIEKDMDKQHQWFEKVFNTIAERYWIIKIKEQSVGLIYLTDMDFTNYRTSWGFYIGEQSFRLYGGLIPPYLYNYVFLELGLHKITAEVMDGNDNVIKLNKIHGCREVGVYKDHIYKNNQFHDIILMELLKVDWIALKKYRKYISKFEQ